MGVLSEVNYFMTSFVIKLGLKKLIYIFSKDIKLCLYPLARTKRAKNSIQDVDTSFLPLWESE